MDPLSAIGLASNILQFIEFGTEICVTIHEVATSATGLTQENEHIQMAVKDLSVATDGLATSVKGNSRHEAELTQLAGSCKTLSDELMGILSKLKTKKGDGLLGSVRIAWKSTTKKNKIASIKARLADYRAQLIFRLNILLYDEQSPTKEHLKRIEQQALDLGNQHGSQMKAQSEQLKIIIQRLDTMNANTGPSSSLTACQAAIEDMRASLASLHSTAKRIPLENDILRALYFPSIFRREDTISSAVGETYQWLLHTEGSLHAVENLESEDEGHRSDTVELRNDDSRPETDAAGENREDYEYNTFNLNNDLTSQIPWWEYEAYQEEALRRQEAADRFRKFLICEHSVFFIHGKAGSGKSTLMKYLADADNFFVRQYLRAWNGDCRLIRVFVFLWNAGDSLQRSLEGLYRSILYQALRGIPELISQVFEKGSNGPHWEELRLPVLDKAVNKLIQALDPQRHKLCLFIDGLDEYEGDSFDQAQLVKNIASWGCRENVKIVCSGRPHLEYMQVFAQQERDLPLHDFTQRDILEYALMIFQDTAGSPSCHAYLDILELAHRISTLAEGVFLWAYLIVRSLSQKLKRYSIKQLNEMLLGTPRNLDTFFDQMLEKVDSLTQKKTEQFLLLAAHNPFRSGLNALSYSWMEDLDDPQFPANVPAQSYTVPEIEQRLELVKTQISDLTRGMLEVKTRDWESPSAYRRLRLYDKDWVHHPFFKYEIEFFHRTFRDYLLCRWHDKAAPTTETYIRLLVAEMKFSCTMEHYHLGGEYLPAGFGSLSGIPHALAWLLHDGKCLSTELCKMLENVLEDYEKLLNSSIPNRQANLSSAPIIGPRFQGGRITKFSWADMERKPALRPFSFPHFIATWSPVVSQYIIETITAHPRSSQPDSSLVILLITLADSGHEGAFMPYFIERGVTPCSEASVLLLERDRVEEFTTSTYLAALGTYTSGHMAGVAGHSHFWGLLENFLRLGADPELLLLVRCDRYEEYTPTIRRTEGEKVIKSAEENERMIRYITLQQLMEIIQPPNIQNLQRYFDRPPARAGSWWNAAAKVISGFSSGQAQHQHDYIAEAESRYPRFDKTDEDANEMKEIVELRTRTHWLPRNAIIQLY
ncbi:hypothetical protein BDV19DRAFT_354101 [Aspergillus venezuelensis]